ncbi:MAG: hypothetical protein LC658_06940 [Bacteroidales bacterium]|nr:hypothetical protein [Bacteroidales bacterium]
MSKEQRAGKWDVFATDLVNPDFAKYAEGCGGLGLQVSENKNVRTALKELFAHEGPALVEFKTDVKLI